MARVPDPAQDSPPPARSGRARAGNRVTRWLLSFLGPAQVSPYTRREVDPTVSLTDPTIPPGYHLEWYTDHAGIRRRVAKRDEDPG